MIGKFKGSQRGFQQQKIVVWTGLVSEIPAGWFICDGNNGTPDLTNKILRGHGSGNTSAGATGGANRRTIAMSQLPSHSHPATMDGTSVGDHNHSIEERNQQYNRADSSTRNQPSYSGGGQSIDTKSNGSHSHTYSVGSTGGDSDTENRPAHRNVLYIMRQ
jgi:microcystin-dependent protein